MVALANPLEARWGHVTCIAYEAMDIIPQSGSFKNQMYNLHLCFPPAPVTGSSGCPNSWVPEQEWQSSASADLQ